MHYLRCKNIEGVLSYLLVYPTIVRKKSIASQLSSSADGIDFFSISTIDGELMPRCVQEGFDMVFEQAWFQPLVILDARS